MLTEQLQQLIDQTDLTISPAHQAQLVSLVGLLNKWNKAYNLTSVRNPARNAWSSILWIR